MEQTAIDKRKTGIFIALSFILKGVISWLLNVASLNFIGYEAVDYVRTQTVNSVTNALSTAVTIAMFLGFGYLLTKNIKKAAIFAGALFSANVFSGVIISLISNITKIIMHVGVITPRVMTSITGVVNIAFIPVNIFIAYFIYTALEGVNTKFPGKSIKDNAMTLSQAKKRYIIVFVITVILSSIVTSLAGILSSYLIADVPYSQLAVNIGSLITWATNTATTVIMFAVMYKPNKSFIEAMSFFSADALGMRLSAVIISVISAIIRVVIYFIVPSTGGSVNNTYSVAVSIVSGIASILGVVLEFVFIFKLLKLYFTDEPKANEYQISTEYNYDSYNVYSSEEREAQLQQKIDTIE